MLKDVVIGPMDKDFILWRCLHGGPLTKDSVDQVAPNEHMPWAELRARNVPLLERLCETYGTCAMVARDGKRVIGHLRFYPRAILAMAACDGFCMQQKHPCGPADNFADTHFPPLEQLQDKTLMVHCLMTASPQQKENPYLRKGIGTRMARSLVEWAKRNGWQAIEAAAYEDLDIVYAVTGAAGKDFWEKLGFRVVKTGVEPALEQEGDFVRALREQAAARGLDPRAIKNKYTMRLELA